MKLGQQVFERFLERFSRYGIELPGHLLSYFRKGSKLDIFYGQLYFWKQEQAYGDESLSKITLNKWCNHFKKEHDPRNGRPQIVTDEVQIETVSYIIQKSHETKLI